MCYTNSLCTYTTPTGLRKLLIRDEDTIRSWLVTDAFHEPYPTTWNDLAITQIDPKWDIDTPQRSVNGSKQDKRCEHSQVPLALRNDTDGSDPDHTELHLPLPYELVELIFQYLSVPALDAARFTCRSWWTMIMSNRAILLSATELEVSSNIRRLAAAFEENANLSATQSHPDSARVRYQLTTVNMSLPQGKAEKAHASQRVLQAAAVTSIGNFFVLYSLFITGNHISRTPAGTGVLTFYYLNPRGPPKCLGSFSVPEKEGPMEISDLPENESKGCWIFSVRKGDFSQPYALISRHGFCASESPYLIKPMGPEHFRLDDAPMHRSLPQFKALQNHANDLVDTDKWRLLAWISLDKVSNIPYMPHKVKNSLPSSKRTQELGDRQPASLRVKEFIEGQQTCFIAEFTHTGDLCVVSGDQSASHWRPPCDPPDEHSAWPSPPSRDSYQRRAVLLPPAANDIYTNVTVSGSVALNSQNERVITVAVIWNSGDDPNPATTNTTLYIYHLPISILTTAPPKQSIPTQTLQGKRISSLPNPLYGGVHPKTRLARLLGHCPSQTPSHVSAMSFSCPPPAQHTATTESPSHPQLYIWGPSTIDDDDNTNISVRIIDLGFSDATTSSLTSRNPNAWGATRLHDGGWDVVIPAAGITGPESSDDRGGGGGRNSDREQQQQQQSTKGVKGFWGGHIAKPADKPDVGGGGSITRADSARQKAALERVENWKRVRVVGMKRAGLADWDVKHLWHKARWSNFGQVSRPRGWETEWHAWEREMEVQLGPLGDNAFPSEYRTSVVRPEFRFSISTMNPSWISRWLL